jgi:hypothetical protein
MAGRVAETVAEAEAQEARPPDAFDDLAWRRFAGTLDGYKIAAELGLDLFAWGAAQAEASGRSGAWGLDVLELRLALFYLLRRDHLSGVTYHELDDLVDGALAALAARLGRPYRRRIP